MKVKSRSEINESDKKRIPSEDRQETNGVERKVVEDQGSQKFPGRYYFSGTNKRRCLKAPSKDTQNFKGKTKGKAKGLGVRRG